MAVAFWVAHPGILSYTWHTTHMVVFLQALDGIGAGILHVAIVAFAADLTRGKGQFNSLLGPSRLHSDRRSVGPIVSGGPATFGFKHDLHRLCHACAAGRCNLSNAWCQNTIRPIDQQTALAVQA